MPASSKNGSAHDPRPRCRRVLVTPSMALADVLDVQPVTEDVWAIVGPREQRNPENLANNATFGLVVTPKGRC